MPDIENIANLRRINTELQERIALLEAALRKQERIVANNEFAGERERCLPVILETIQDGFWSLDKEMRIVDANEVYCRMSGYTKAELFELTIHDLEAAETSKEIDERRQRIIRNGTERFETRHRRKDGQIFDIEISATCLNPNQDNRQFISFCRDITERKRAEQALRESEMLYRSILKASPENITITDLEGRIRIFSPSALTMFGYTKEEDVWGHLTSEFIIPEDRERAKSRVEMIHQGALMESKEYTGVRADGSLFAIEVKGDLIRNMAGQPTGMVFIIRDITERKRIEQALRESEALYRSILKASPDGITITDLEGRIRINSPSALTMFGYTQEEEVLGHPITGFLVSEDRERAQRNIALMYQGVFTGLGEYRAVRPDGSTFHIETNGEFIRGMDGQPTGMVFISRDISERKRAEEALQETSMKLERTVKAGHIGLWDLDLKTNRVFHSAECKRMIGYGEDEIGDSPDEWQHLVHPDDLKPAWDIVNGAMTSGLAGCEVEARLRHRDGAYRWVLIQASIVRDEAGHPVRVVGSQTDITKRKRTELMLVESEKHFSTIFRNSPAAIGISCLRDGQFVDVNAAFLRLYGYSREEIIGHTSEELGLWESANREQVFEDLREKKYLQNVEILARRKTGEIRNILASLELVELGGELCIQAILIDITERKRAEEALQQSERNYREIFNATNEAIFLGDPTAIRIIDANDAMVRMTGYDSKEELLTCNIWDLMVNEPPYTHEEAVRRIRLALKQGQVFDWIGCKKNGDRRWVEVSLRSTEIGGKGYILAVARDITERKLAEAERERLLAAIEQAGEIIIITDPNGTIQYVNPSFERVTNYSREEAIGQNPRMLKSGEHDKAFYASMWQALTAGRTWEGRLINKRKDGTLYTEVAAISPVHDTSGTIVNYVGIKRDITRELETEQRLLQAQKMESVGRLAGGVAHDFNNILMAIMGYVELCRYELPDSHPVHRWLDEINSGAERSANLTRQLLAFARKQTISPKVLDINDTVSRMLKLLQRLIGEHIHLVWMPGTNLWPVRLDPSQIDQILTNLCVNARDAITSTGKVTIETVNVTLDDACCADHVEVVPGNYVLLTVSDNGCGMEKNILEHIFDPFFTTKEVGKGTGLGLATVYGIVKQNNGHISAESEPGKGTTINIYLPCFVGKSAETTVKPTTEGPKGRGETVLLVEDEQLLCTTCCLLLEALGYTVLAAESPEEALDVVSRHSGDIHLLLTDVIMPNMDGKQLAERLCEARPNLKVLFMSGYTASALTHDGVLEEGVHFIGKPFSRDTLAREVRKILDTP
ncbi:MAG: PAS domain S-box protein [Chlorobiales bacterium]|nr:PAS domain S-box protein [Chlorobiales bacterium]